MIYKWILCSFTFRYVNTCSCLRFNSCTTVFLNINRKIILNLLNGKTLRTSLDKEFILCLIFNIWLLLLDRALNKILVWIVTFLYLLVIHTVRMRLNSSIWIFHITFILMIICLIYDSLRDLSWFWCYITIISILTMLSLLLMTNHSFILVLNHLFASTYLLLSSYYFISVMSRFFLFNYIFINI
jgi:hypothetical protein